MGTINLHVQPYLLGGGYHAYFTTPHGHNECEAYVEYCEGHTAINAIVMINNNCVYCNNATNYHVPVSVEGLVQMVEHVLGHTVVLV